MMRQDGLDALDTGLLLTQRNAVTDKCLMPGPVLPFCLAVAMKIEHQHMGDAKAGAGLQVWSQNAYIPMYVWGKDMRCP